jgi:tripartite-type tricarboxylate transporter receptor subunit TctC
MNVFCRTLAVTICIGTCLTAAQAQAQEWPTQPIRLIANAAAGGGVDLVARSIAEPLSRRLGVAVVVDNRGGAGGNIAAEQVARAAPDGYTLLLASSAIVISPAMYKTLSYSVEKDFAPISMVATSATALAARPDFGPSTIPELIKAAKAAPAKITFGSAGIGTTNHLAGELLKALAGIELVHVPFKGGGPAIQALIGGQIDLVVSSTLELAPRITSGKVKGIAVTNAVRSAVLPDLPTIAESLPGYECTIWFGLFAPAATPKQVVSKLASESVALARLDDVKARLTKVGATLVASDPEALARAVREDVPKWQRVTKQAGITPE